MLTLSIAIIIGFAIIANEYVKILFQRDRHNNHYTNIMKLSRYRT